MTLAGSDAVVRCARIDLPHAGGVPAPARADVRARALHPGFGLPLAVGFGFVSRPALALVADDDFRSSPAPARPIPVLRLIPRPIGPVESSPVSLTPRGRRALAVGAITIGLAVAASSLLGTHAASTAPAGSTPARVTVDDGDTLWSIAQRIAPGRDPRDEVSDLRRINGLIGTVLAPGQSLRTR